MNAHQRVRAQVQLSGIVSGAPVPGPEIASTVALRIRVTGVLLREFPGEGTADGTADRVADGNRETRVDPDEYRAARPDPLHPCAAEHLQHLSARHPEAVEVLSRLCGARALIGATRVLPIALDRYGMLLRIERLRTHQDVRLPFTRRIDTGAEAAEEIRHLLTLGARRRLCGR